MGFKTLVIPTLILLAGVANDLRSRKVNNALVLICAFIALVSHFYFAGVPGLINGGLAALTALALTLPLVLARVLGAGDMKLFIAFAFAVNPNAVFISAVYSIFAGALLGVFRAIASGNGILLLKNTGAILKGHKIQDLQTTKIPYTVALLFGWMTYVSLEIQGGGL